jgi:hypothetical protein
VTNADFPDAADLNNSMSIQERGAVGGIANVLI